MKKEDFRIKDYQDRFARRMLRPEVHGLVAVFGTGMGKTVTALHSAKLLIKQDARRRVLIVAPLLLIEQYREDAGLVGLGVDLVPKKNFMSRDYFYQNKCHELCGPETILIVDEAHNLKNPFGRRTRQVTLGAQRAGKVILLTATVMPKWPLDLLALLNMVCDPRKPLVEEGRATERRGAMMGKTVLNAISIKTFADMHRQHGHDKLAQLVAPYFVFESKHGNLPTVWNFVAPIVIRPTMLAANVHRPQMPGTLASGEPAPGSGEEDSGLGSDADAGSDSEAEVGSDADYTGLGADDSDDDDTDSVVSAEVKKVLRQVGKRLGEDHFYTRARQMMNQAIETGRGDGGLMISAKGTRILELLNTFARANPNANLRGLVYSQFLDKGLNTIESLLKAEGYTVIKITGKDSKPKREVAKKKYNSVDAKRVVMLVSGAGAEGMTLLRTDMVFLMEPSWTWSRREQVIGRGVRLGSHKDQDEPTVMVFDLLLLNDYELLTPKQLMEYRAGDTDLAADTAERARNLDADEDQDKATVSDELPIYFKENLKIDGRNKLLPLLKDRQATLRKKYNIHISGDASVELFIYTYSYAMHLENEAFMDRMRYFASRYQAHM